MNFLVISLTKSTVASQSLRTLEFACAFVGALVDMPLYCLKLERKL